MGTKCDVGRKILLPLVLVTVVAKLRIRYAMPRSLVVCGSSGIKYFAPKRVASPSPSPAPPSSSTSSIRRDVRRAAVKNPARSLEATFKDQTDPAKRLHRIGIDVTRYSSIIRSSDHRVDAEVHDESLLPSRVVNSFFFFYLYRAVNENELRTMRLYSYSVRTRTEPRLSP